MLYFYCTHGMHASVAKSLQDWTSYVVQPQPTARLHRDVSEVLTARPRLATEIIKASVIAIRGTLIA